jgi:two-component system, OmpR family, phosphate regulon sensor histidine kinase PhoR
MSKKKIRFIIGLMAISLVGLVSFQMYWIKLAIAEKNERFNQSVHEAMESVVKGLEKQEILYLASQRIRMAEKEKAERIAQESRRQEREKQLAAQARQKLQAARLASESHRKKQNSKKQIVREPFFPESTQWNVTVLDAYTQSITPEMMEWMAIGQNQPMDFNWSFFGSEGTGQPAAPFHLNEAERKALGLPLEENTLYTSGFQTGKPKTDVIFKNKKRPGKSPKRDSKKLKAISVESGYAYTFHYSNDAAWPNLLATEQEGFFLDKDSMVSLLNRHLKNRYVQDSVTQHWLQQMNSRQMLMWNDLLAGQPQLYIQTLSNGRPKVQLPKKSKQAPTFNDFYANLDTVESIKTSFKENFDKVEKKAEVMQDVFNALVTVERTLDNRINGRMLDSLLRREIRNRGIDIPFEYGVHSKDNHGVLFASLQGPPSRLLDSPFRVNLFPNDLNCEGNYLMVNFPGQKQYIFQKLGFVFISSAVLILVIISCFYVAITTILKQKKLSEIKNDFINNMTHEFKTPIATISLACEVLQEATVTNDPVKRTRYLNVIHDENKRLGSQVEKVLQSAMLDKGNVKLKLSQVDIHEVIDNALQNIGVQIEQRQGEINLDLQAENTVVEADEMHLTNIVHNLLDNANKYSPEQLQITIQTRSTREGVYLTVADKGIGMTKDAIQRIFERFYRIPTGNVHNVKGFGLGLSYVKTILQMHQGHIRVDSQLHKGSAFEIFLPYAQG